MAARKATSFEWLQDVLAVAGAEAQPAEELEQLRVHARDLELEERRLAVLLDALVELALDLLDHLFDARRMDAAVGDQPLERDAGDLAAEGVEAGEDDRLGGVVDDEVDAGRHLESADVAPFAADDAPLHLVTRQLDDRYRGLGDVVGGEPLHGHGHQPVRLTVALLARLVLDSLDQVGGLEPGVVLERADQLLARLLRREAGDLLELRARLARQAVGLARPLLDRLLAAGERLLAPGELLVALALLLEPLVERVFFLGQPLLDRFELLASLAGGVLEFGARGEQLLLRRELRLADLGFAFALGFLEQALGAAASVGELGLAPAADRRPAKSDDREGDHGRTGDQQNFRHGSTPGGKERVRRDGWSPGAPPSGRVSEAFRT